MVSVTLDSNVFISALNYGGAAARLLGLARQELMRIDTSEPIVNETIGVLRDKFGWDGYRLHFARQQIYRLSNLVAPSQTIGVADDPDDNRILECASAAGSDYIVTEDIDLLRLQEHGNTPILRVAQFLRLQGYV